MPYRTLEKDGTVSEGFAERTLIDWQGKPAADSRRYAACGDAVTVPVARWLGERLAAA